MFLQGIDLNYTYLKTNETATFINKVGGCLPALIGRLPPAFSFNGVPWCLKATKSDPFFEPFRRFLVNNEKVLGQKEELPAGRESNNRVYLIFTSSYYLYNL